MRVFRSRVATLFTDRVPGSINWIVRNRGEGDTGMEIVDIEIAQEWDCNNDSGCDWDN